jgi:hypothetical protein
MRGAVLVMAFLIGCGGDSSVDPCVKAWDKVTRLGDPSLGGSSYGAFQFGLECALLKPSHLACIDATDDERDLRRCVPRGEALYEFDDEARPFSAAELDGIADAACACRDLECVIEFGKKLGRDRSRLDKTSVPYEVGREIEECIKRVR